MEQKTLVVFVHCRCSDAHNTDCKFLKIETSSHIIEKRINLHDGYLHSYFSGFVDVGILSFYGKNRFENS